MLFTSLFTSITTYRKIWYKGKRGVMHYKISNIEGFEDMDDDEKQIYYSLLLKKFFIEMLK